MLILVTFCPRCLWTPGRASLVSSGVQSVWFCMHELWEYICGHYIVLRLELSGYWNLTAPLALSSDSRLCQSFSIMPADVKRSATIGTGGSPDPRQGRVDISEPVLPTPPWTSPAVPSFPFGADGERPAPQAHFQYRGFIKTHFSRPGHGRKCS